ncbi:MAG: hypothetical protein ACRENY_09530 [Candidatus Dormibacteria bacterium]
MAKPSGVLALRRMVLGTAISVIVQAGIGMDVNLFVAIPSHHSGAQPADFFTGSLSSLLWAITHGGLALAVHTLLGIVLIVMVIAVVVRAARLRRRASTIWSALGACLVVAAAFNGASFLDFHLDLNSLLMALFAFASVICYLALLESLSTSVESSTR